MAAYALKQTLNDSHNETELFARIQMELVNRYQVDPNLASEMTWDFLEVLSAVDGNLDIFEKYFLH